MAFDGVTFGLIGGSFLLAGFAKGVVGLGLPTISLALLTVFLDLPTAMALLVVPSLCTNIWQGLVGGHLAVLLRRLWPLFAAAIIMVWLGVVIADHIDQAMLTRILGGLLVIYAAMSLTVTPPSIPRRLEKILAPVCGASNGLLTGLTGSLFMPGVIYLQALGLPRDQLVQAMGLLFAVSTAALGAGLEGAGRVQADIWQLSCFAVVPALIGMICGAYCRHYLSETIFRKIFLVALIMLGLYIMA